MNWLSAEARNWDGVGCGIVTRMGGEISGHGVVGTATQDPLTSSSMFTT